MVRQITGFWPSTYSFHNAIGADEEILSAPTLQSAQSQPILVDNGNIAPKLVMTDESGPRPMSPASVAAAQLPVSIPITAPSSPVNYKNIAILAAVVIVVGLFIKFK